MNWRNILNSTQEDLSSVPVPPFRFEGSICDVNISESLVLQKLCSLKDNKAPGPDSIHAYILKACACSLCTSFAMIFQQSLTSGNLPNDWKKANVISVFKKGSKFKAINYRPISLTYTVVKQSYANRFITSCIIHYERLCFRCTHWFGTSIWREGPRCVVYSWPETICPLLQSCC